MQEELWQRFLLLNAGVEDEEEAQILLASLADWLDEDEEVRENGAEAGYYSQQIPSYIPADRPIMLAEELLLVKGWEKELLYGGQGKTGEEQAGIIEYLTTVAGDGKININTAPALVLEALHEDMTAELAAMLLDFREQEENQEALEELEWYQDVPRFPRKSFRLTGPS